jgi:hypothetical protein
MNYVMQEFTIGVYSENGAIHEFTVNAEKISIKGEKEDIYFELEGQGSRVLISSEAFVFGGPSAMIVKKT